MRKNATAVVNELIEADMTSPADRFAFRRTGGTRVIAALNREGFVILHADDLRAALLGITKCLHVLIADQVSQAIREADLSSVVVGSKPAAPASAAAETAD